jgi:acetyltransferase
VKMSSRFVAHKSDIGGVVLNVTTVPQAIKAAAGIRARFETAYPGMPLDGFTVQPMITLKGATELLAGLSTDPIFGPVVTFGAGGTSVEIVDDTATGLVPLDSVLAEDLIDRTRISRLLKGYRDVAPVDRGAIVGTLLALSQLAIDFPMITSIDINPLLAGPDGTMALDARLEIDPARSHLGAPNPALAICPYPAAASSSIQLGDVSFAVRPIRPEDAELYPHFLERIDAEDMRMRFLVPTKTLSRQTMIRLTQLDYDRDIAFVAIEPGGELAGIVRYSADPDKGSAEFGVLVRSDLKRQGLGRALMEKLIGYARSQGIAELSGLILRENGPMLTLCRELGFEVATAKGEATLFHATLALRPSA